MPECKYATLCVDALSSSSLPPEAKIVEIPPPSIASYSLPCSNNAEHSAAMRLCSFVELKISRSAALSTGSA